MMISLGSGMQALSMAMQRTIPPYPSAEMTARIHAASGATIRSSRCTREPYATRFTADKRKDFRLEGFRVRVIASKLDDILLRSMVAPAPARAVRGRPPRSGSPGRARAPRGCRDEGSSFLDLLHVRD